MTLDLDELERLEREDLIASPWEAGDEFPGDVWGRSGTQLVGNFEESSVADGIVAARNALPALLAELRALRNVAEAAEDHVDNHGRDDTYGPLVAAVKAWRGSR